MKEVGTYIESCLFYPIAEPENIRKHSKYLPEDTLSVIYL